MARIYCIFSPRAIIFEGKIYSCFTLVPVPPSRLSPQNSVNIVEYRIVYGVYSYHSLSFFTYKRSIRSLTPRRPLNTPLLPPRSSSHALCTNVSKEVSRIQNNSIRGRTHRTFVIFLHSLVQFHAFFLRVFDFLYRWAVLVHEGFQKLSQFIERRISILRLIFSPFLAASLHIRPSTRSRYVLYVATRIRTRRYVWNNIIRSSRYRARWYVV